MRTPHPKIKNIGDFRREFFHNFHLNPKPWMSSSGSFLLQLSPQDL